MRFSCLLSLLALTACSTSLDTADYDTTCTGPTDCVTLPMGDMCDCSCGQGAINKKSVDQYNTDRARIGGCSRLCKPCAALQGATCTAGRCVLAGVKLPVDGGQD